jgi:DNA-binding transcriptional LysR family regulator
MPYGIQQPAVSSQILMLEEDLGVKLFERQPFKLTPAGVDLLAFVQPFFENIAPMAAQLRRGAAPQLRIGAPETILIHHLPILLERVKQAHPELHLYVRSGLQPQLETWVRDRDIDLAVMPVGRRLAAPLRSIRLVQLPLVLLGPRGETPANAADYWARGRPVVPLIALPDSDPITQLFQSGLKRLGVTWPPSVEASSLGLIKQYVANGYGVGVSIAVPDLIEHPKVGVLPLDGFEQLELAAVWQGKPSAILKSLLDEMQRYAAQFWPRTRQDST